MCLDQMGPESAKSHPGRQVVHSPQSRPDQPAERARQEIDYGRRGGGYIFGAFQPATGAAFTRPYPGRTIVNWVDFLEHVEDWLPEEADRIYAIVDTSTCIGPSMCCCSASPTPVGGLSSSPNTRPI